jgi:uncharacterized RDD family membrane protein YckC
VTTVTNDRRTAAGIWDRSLAFASDYLMIAAYLAMIVAGGAALMRFSPAISNALFGGPVVGQITGFLLITLPVTLYFALSDASAFQATWGKRRMRLKVVDCGGRPLRRTRSVGRTALKFVPWELAHTCIWQVSFAADQSDSVYMIGFSVVWLLVGVNVLSLLVSPTKQTIYDRLAGTLVQRAG